MIVRRDLPLGVIVAQTIHAAGESSPGNIPGDTHAVALAADSEADLLALEQRLLASAVPHVAIREPDAPWNGQLMAIGVVPMVRTPDLKKLFRQYALLR